MYFGTIFFILRSTKLIKCPFRPKSSPADVIITFFIDVIPEEAFNRKSKEKDRIEMAGIELQNRVRDTYLKLSQRFQDRYKVIDGHDSIDNIHTKILDEIRSREYI